MTCTLVRAHSPRKLRHILSLADLEPAARRHLPRPIFGYICGAVEDGVSLRANRTAFDKWTLLPRVLVNVSARTRNTELFGNSYSAPFGIAPMGISALAAYQGDLVLARAAEQAGIPMIMSGASLTRMEQVAAVAPNTSWFQAYLPGEAAQIEALVARVRAAGFKTLVLTVDCATLANRESNVRVGFSTPLRPGVRLAWDGITRPRWLFGTLARTLLTTGMPHFENASAVRGAPIISSNAVRQFGLRDHLCWKHLALMRRLWQGNLVLKGILSADDARIAADHGVDGVIVSNHGGRQLDGAAAPLRVLPDIVAAKGRMKVMCDSGIRRGTDVLKALSLGADFVFVGRPFLYAAAIAGEPGVAHAIELLSAEVLRDMALLGVTSTAELGPHCLLAA
jgi:L-lactate dehydrogenase (cytochrome)